MNAINVSGDHVGDIITGNGNQVEHNYYNGAVVNEYKALPPQRKNVSPQPPPVPDFFVGRKRELEKVDDWITQSKVVVIHGMDGIGKTCLLKQAANGDCAASQKDGVVFQEGLDEDGKLLAFGDVVQRVFDALFDSFPRLKVDLSSARTYLSGTHPLVLLNWTNLSVQNLKQLQNLFSRAPILIATENQALLRGNRNNIRLGPLDREDAMELLASLTSVEDQETFGQIAALLENVPAALSMVADAIRVDGLQAEDVLKRLESYTPKDENKAKAAVERAFQLVYSLLPEKHRGMLDQVAASYGISVDRKWLESVCGGSAVSENLEERGLLFANSPRLRLLPGLRPLLLEGRDLTNERQRLLNYLLGELKTRWNDFDFIKDEMGNLLGLLSWAAAQGQWANVAALGRGVDPYLMLNGLWGAWHTTLELVNQAALATQDLALHGWALHQLGSYEIGMGNHAAARRLLEQAVSIRQELGDQTGVAYSQHNLQGLIPFTGTTAQTLNSLNFGNLLRWLLGGLALLALGFYLFFSNNPPKLELPSAPDEVPIVVSPSATKTATSTPTQTPPPTVTATYTASPTSTPTVPTYIILNNRRVLRDQTPCRVGPSGVYQDAGISLGKSNVMDVLGRNEDGTWLRVNFSPPQYLIGHDACWMRAPGLDVTSEEIMSVQPVEPDKDLPFGDRTTYGVYIPDPDPNAARTGDTVNVYWHFYYLRPGDVESLMSPRYLIEAWVCRNGEIVFEPSGWPWPYDEDHAMGEVVSASIKDEAGCTEPSHGRLYLSWKHGYLPPVEIMWPQSETVQSMPVP